MLIGRNKETKILKTVLQSEKAEMIAVSGRRGVGKTYLIRETYADQIIFEQTGVRNASNAEQLRTFTNSLRLLTDADIELPKDWLDAFFLLRKTLTPLLDKEKKAVLFFDELSWLATPGSKFLDFLGHFWNDWASRQNLVIVLCGSASSWIIRKVINDKGGLHNRVTKYLRLQPFTLAETEEYFQAKRINFTRYQIVQLYMALGGIPLYLESVEKDKSALQNINEICFLETGLLRNEFDRLYPALFDSAEHHIAVIRALASKRTGLSRSQIINAAKVPNGSGTSRVLEELEQSDFIMAYHPFGKKKKDKIYRLTDEYSLFYLRFIENSVYQGEGTFMQLSQRQEFKIWSGYAYESICMKHLPAIKKALSIAGVYSTVYSYFRKAKADEKGLQVDMLLERADQVINLFEVKFYNTEFVLTKDYAERLRERERTFLRLTKTRAQIQSCLITTFGIKENEYSRDVLHRSLTLEDLFIPFS